LIYASANSTVQPEGIPDVPNEFSQVAAEFFTNVPDAETPLTQWLLALDGYVVNIAFM
jgi:hypothetical protein